LFLAKKKPTLKRYGGEGAESMMAFVDELYHNASRGKKIKNTIAFAVYFSQLRDVIKIS